MELKNLNILKNETETKYHNSFSFSDRRLPRRFKELITQFDNDRITYNEYSFEVQRSSEGIIVAPNQWLYIAAFYSSYCREMIAYKQELIDHLLKEYSSKKALEEPIKDCQNNEEKAYTLLKRYPEGTNKEYLVKFLYDYSWWGGAKTIDRSDFCASAILSSTRLVNATHGYVADICEFLAKNPEAESILLTSPEIDDGKDKGKIFEGHKSQSLQQIFYGAPGTGKSHEVKKLTGEWISEDKDQDLPNVFRTTIHPDTDYASFVGCYKPTMKPTSKEEKTLTGKDEEIVYEFVPQAFTDAYIYAYTHSTEQTYLVIEEINRGNCAQIFGDLFQLLDRKGGVSEYKIKADKDLANYLIEKLGEDSEGIKDGKLSLPANLNILATMNTSDQSLFPMDSAFKRRWEWEYVPINYSSDIKSGTFNITIGKKDYPWVGFIEEANKRIFDLTQSEDKQLGNFFIKHSVDEKEFKSKVMFYLWYEVLRDETENNKYFFYKKTTIDGKENLAKFIFKDLYEEDATLTLQQFMDYLGVASE